MQQTIIYSAAIKNINKDINKRIKLSSTISIIRYSEYHAENNFLIFFCISYVSYMIWSYISVRCNNLSGRHLMSHFILFRLNANNLKHWLLLLFSISAYYCYSTIFFDNSYFSSWSFIVENLMIIRDRFFPWLLSRFLEIIRMNSVAFFLRSDIVGIERSLPILQNDFASIETE